MTVFPSVVILLISLAVMFLSIWHLYAGEVPKQLEMSRWRVY